MEDQSPLCDEKPQTEPVSNEWVDISGDGGVLKQIIKTGKQGKSVPANCKVNVHYVGTLEDGSKFDSSRDRDQKFSFRLGKGEVIKGWDLGIASMLKGELANFKIKPEYGYGDKSQGKIPANSILNFEVELISWTTGEDITYDGGVKKTNLLIAGDPSVAGKPSELNWVITNFKLALKESGTVVLEKNDFKFVLGDEEVACPGVEKALEKMHKGEKSEFLLQPKYGYGDSGSRELNVPPNSVLSATIELLDFEVEKPSWEMSAEEKIAVAKARKEEGNHLFKEGKAKLALKRFEKVKSLVSYIGSATDEQKSGAKELEQTALLNKTACYMQLKDWQTLLKECDSFLKDNPNHPKALFRKAKALSETMEWEEAQKLLIRCSELAPADQAVKKELQVLRCKMQDHDRALRSRYKNLFA